MRTRHLTAIPTIFCFLAISAAWGQEFWRSKDYLKWSNQECARLLRKSPWAKETGIATPVFATVDQTTAMSAAGRESTSEVTYVVQLRSAAPVRKAVARQQLIQANVDRQPHQQQKAFELRRKSSSRRR